MSVSHHVLHLEPRVHPQQTCLESETTVEPRPAVDSAGQDYFGNPIRHLTVQKPHKRLVVDARSRVEVRPAGGNACAPGRARRGRTCASEVAAYEALDAYELAFESPYVVGNEAIHDYALQSFTPGRPILDATMDPHDAASFASSSTVGSLGRVDARRRRVRDAARAFARTSRTS